MIVFMNSSWIVSQEIATTLSTCERFLNGMFHIMNWNIIVLYENVTTFVTSVMFRQNVVVAKINICVLLCRTIVSIEYIITQFNGLKRFAVGT